MKPALLVAAFYIAANIAVWAVVGVTIGLPRRGPPVDLYDPHGRSSGGAAAASRPRPGDGWQISAENRALGMLVESSAFTRAERPQLIVMGASVAAVGWRPPLLARELPEYQCSNLAIERANVTVIKQTLDAVLAALPAGIRTRSVLVLGIGYNAFMPDAIRWATPATAPAAGDGPAPPATCVDAAMRRCPLILDARDPVGRMLPPVVIHAATERFRVWRLLTVEWHSHPSDVITNRDVWRFQGWRGRTPGGRGPGPETYGEMTITERIGEIDRRMGPPGLDFDRDQCEKFVALVRQAAEAGMQVVVVDLPLPSGHRRAAPRFEPFRRRLAELLAPLVERGDATLLDRTDALGDEHFRDLAHPAPASLGVWAKLLADGLGPVLRPQPPRTRD